MAGEGAQAWDALIEAATEGDRATCATLLNGRMYAASKIVNATDALERTALSWACTWGRNACAELLLSKRADPNLADSYGYTALHECCSFGHVKCLKLLLANGGDPNQANTVGEGPLHVACNRGRADCVKLLLENGGLQNRPSQTGGLPIHVACFSGQPACVDALLRAASKHDLHNHEHARFDGMTAWQRAHFRGNKACAERVPGAPADRPELPGPQHAPRC